MPDLAETLKTLELTTECLTAAEQVIDGLLHSAAEMETRRRVWALREAKRRLADHSSR